MTSGTRVNSPSFERRWPRAVCARSSSRRKIHTLANTSRRVSSARRWISEFTGSAGTVVVTDDEALLWTDGRYFVQAEEELSEDWTLMRSGTKGTPDAKTWLKTTMAAGSAVGIDPNVHSVSEARELRKALEESECEVVALEENLVDSIWSDRPAFPKTKLRVHPAEFAGQTVEEKLTHIREKMKENGTQRLVVSSLDDVMWLCNVRGEMRRVIR